MDTVYKFDKLPTKKEGIFVMPLERITILSTFLVYVDDPNDIEGTTFVLSRNEIGNLGGSKQDSISMLPCICTLNWSFFAHADTLLFPDMFVWESLAVGTDAA
jgi:hypothetical protein